MGIDEFVGMAGGCGRLPSDGEVDAFMIDKTIGIAEEEIEGLANDMGTMSAEEVQACADFVEGEIKSIVEAFENGQK